MPGIFFLASGSLPAGMHLSADGVLSGTPTGHEVARFTLQVTDATGSTAQQSYTVETLSADAAAAADDPASPPPTFTREVRTRSVSLAQSGGVNETIEDRYTSDDGERDELIGQGFATTENDNPSFRYKLWKRNSVNDPAGWTYTSGSENLMSPEEVKSIIDAQGDGPALSVVMDGIDRAAFVAGQSSTDSVSAGTSRYKGFVVGSWTDVRMRSSKPVKEDTTFTFLLSTGSSSSASPAAPKTYRTVSVTIPKGRTQPLEGGDDSHGTIQLRPDMKVMTLMPIDIEEVISDQIAGNNANKLPTAYFKDEQNNPMLMATRSGQKAKIRVKMASGSDPRVYVGARKSGTQAILGYASVTTAEVPLEIDVPANSHDIYEIVAGYDTNSNSKLDESEVVTTFKKTPLEDASGGTVSDPQNLLDRVIIVDQGQFSSSKNTVIGYNYPGSEYAGDLIEGFARGRTTIPNSTMVPLVSVSSTQPGLGHPVGGKWNASNQDTTYRFTFADGSPASNDTEASNALKQIVQKVINDNKAAMISAYAGTPEWPVSPWYNFSEEKDFIKTDGEPEIFGVPLGIPELGASFGKVKITGRLRVSYKKTSATTIQVGSVEVIGSYDDLYDFAYGGGSRARQASMVQAGHATLAGTTEPNGGKVFFTRVEFNSGFANTWNGNY